MEDSPETVSVFAHADIAVLRSGKARKNDPPIPADLAPISGSGKRVRREETESEAMVLEPIRFRYSTESVVTETEQPAPEQTEQKVPSGRRRRGPKNEGPKETKQEPRQEKPKQSKAPAAEYDERSEKKPSRRRPNYRRRRGKNPNGGQETPKES